MSLIPQDRQLVTRLMREGAADDPQMMEAVKCRYTRRIAEVRARSHGHRQSLQIVHVDRVRRRVHTLKTAPLDSGPDAAPAFLLFQKYSSSSFSAAAVVEFTTIRSPGPQHPGSRSPSAVRRVALSTTTHVHPRRS